MVVNETDPLVALLPEMVTGLPKFTPLVRNWNVPVGVPAPGEVTEIVAVKVSDWPNTDGLADDATVEVVLALLTVCVSGEAVLSLPLKLLSPL